MVCEEEGRRVWMGLFRIRLEAGLRCASVRRESISIISFQYSGPLRWLTRSREIRRPVVVRHEGITPDGGSEVEKEGVWI